MAKKNTAEGVVAQVALQETKTVEVGGKSYEVAPPSIATLIKVSEYISFMPEVNTDTDDPIGESLRIAKDCSAIGDILATVILGAKKVKSSGKRIYGIIPAKDEFGELSDALMYEKTPKELSELLRDLMVNRMDIGFFFGITTSLSGINLTKPTKTTASGRS